MKKDVVIKVENLSKIYTIGEIEKYLTLRDQLTKIPKKIVNSFSKKKAPTFWALKNISFEVNKGEIIGIIGRNGAGKSTLLKILTKITEPTNGIVTMKGKIASLLEVGTGFNPELTGRENIFLSGAIIGMSKREIISKLDSIIEFSGIEQFIDTPVKRYSSGMYVRLAFAVAAHLESDILLVDEVLAVGDADFQKKCLGKMENLVESGRTVIFVSHNMGAIAKLCTKTIFLKEGKIVSYEDTQKAISRYLSAPKKIKSDDLSKIKQRNGKGEVIITQLSYTNSKGKVIEGPIVGEEVNIHIKYKSNIKKELIDPKFGIIIANHFGQTITMLHSYQAETKFKLLPLSGEVICTIKKFPLMSGEYYLSVGVNIGGVLQDEIEVPKPMAVKNGTYFINGMIGLDPKYQGVFIDQKWEQDEK